MAGLATPLVDTAVTLDAELSPRKLDLVGVKGVIEILTVAGKLNQDGEPLSVGRVSNLTKKHPTFPKPWIEGSGRRFWRRADVEKWADHWDQKAGPRFKDA